MKKTNIIYWISTVFIFLFEGLMPALTSQTELAKQGISQLGYPAYFGVMLTVFKVAGATAILLPVIKGSLKEWAYAGLTFELIAASVSNAVIFGIGFSFFMPLIVLAILGISYFCYHKRSVTATSQFKSGSLAY